MPALPGPDRIRFRAILGIAWAVLLSPAFTAEEGSAQLRELVASQIGVSDEEATLHLELEGGQAFDVTFEDGTVRADGETLGSYERGGELDRAWRELLGAAVTLDDGPLVRLLVGWTPPEGLDGEGRELANRIRGLLERRLSSAPGEIGDAPASGPLSVVVSPEALDALLRNERIRALREALGDPPSDRIEIRTGDGVSVAEGERMEGTLAVVDGEAEIVGTITGDLLVIDGTARITEEGRVEGSVYLMDGDLTSEDGTVAGEVVEVTVPRAPPGGVDVDELRERIEGEIGDLDELREEIRREVRSELRDELRRDLREDERGLAEWLTSLAPLGNLIGGLAGLLQNLIGFAILGLIGVAVLRFFPEEIEAVADVARLEPGRAAVVGLAGSFLVLPVWLLGILVLLVSIVGIPALLAWIPGVPLAAVLAAGFGYLAIAGIVGEWLARQNLPNLEFLRPSNAIHTLGLGIAALLLPFAAANVAEMGGRWFDLLEGLFVAVGWIGAMAATFVGLGAVILSRGGRRGFWRWRRGAEDPIPDWGSAGSPGSSQDPSPSPGAGTEAPGPGPGDRDEASVDADGREDSPGTGRPRDRQRDSADSPEAGDNDAP